MELHPFQWSFSMQYFFFAILCLDSDGNININKIVPYQENLVNWSNPKLSIPLLHLNSNLQLILQKH